MAKKKKKVSRGGTSAAAAASPADVVQLEAATIERHRKERKAMSKQCAKLEQDMILAQDEKEKAALAKEIEDKQTQLQVRHKKELQEVQDKIESVEDQVVNYAAIAEKDSSGDASGEKDGSAQGEKDKKRGKRRGDDEDDEDAGDKALLAMTANRTGEQKKSKSQLRKEKKLAQQRALEEESIRRAGEKVDKRAIETQALESLLAPLEKRLVEVPGDGDCLYHALALQLSTDELHVRALRQKTAAYLREHRDEFAPFIDENFDEYCTTLENTPAWGGEIEIRALANVLNRPIVVYSAFSDAMTMGPQDNTGVEARPPLGLSFHQHYLALGAHYNAVVPL